MLFGTVGKTMNVEDSRIAKGRRLNRLDIIRLDVLSRHTVRRIHLTLETTLRFFAPSRRSRTEAITLFSCYLALLIPVVSVPALGKKGEASHRERGREKQKCRAYSDYSEQFLLERVQ